MNLLNFSTQEKKIRAEIIKEYLFCLNTDKTVCFSCGNASRNLKETGLNVIEVVNPERWWDQFEIAGKYKIFDSTSGHLPMFLMKKIAEQLRDLVNMKLDKTKVNYIEAGSGETFVCLKIAFPEIEMTPVYDDSKKATKYNELAPLNNLVRALSYNHTTIIKKNINEN